MPMQFDIEGFMRMRREKGDSAEELKLVRESVEEFARMLETSKDSQATNRVKWFMMRLFGQAIDRSEFVEWDQCVSKITDPPEESDCDKREVIYLAALNGEKMGEDEEAMFFNLYHEGIAGDDDEKQGAMRSLIRGLLSMALLERFQKETPGALKNKASNSIVLTIDSSHTSETMSVVLPVDSARELGSKLIEIANHARSRHLI